MRGRGGKSDGAVGGGLNECGASVGGKAKGGEDDEGVEQVENIQTQKRRGREPNVTPSRPRGSAPSPAPRNRTLPLE